MIQWPSLPIYLHREPVDFRKAINGLSVLVEQGMSLSPFDPALFVFCNKRRDKLKVLYWHRLDNTHFIICHFKYQVQKVHRELGIDKEPVMPNSLYTLYQEKFGISIVSVKDEVRAIVLPDDYAEHLNLKGGTPALMVERSSINIDGRIVEWSKACCSTENFVYSVHLK